MRRKIITFLLILASALFLAIVYKKIFKISNEVNDSIPGASIETLASINKSDRSNEQDIGQTTHPPLCKNQTSIIIFGTMKPLEMRRFLEHNTDVKNCKLPDKVTTCLFTNDSKYYKIADVLHVQLCRYTKLLERAYPEQLVLGQNRDPERFGCNRPSFVMKIADVSVSYSLSSTIPYPFVCSPYIQQPLLNILNLNPPSDRNGIAMFISNCAIWRYNYIKKLMDYIHIDSYGECLHNVNIHSSRMRGSDEHLTVKINLIKSKKYKFLISFENCVLQEYVSEKIWDAYLSQTIPIYHGTPDVYHQVPDNNTFIDAAKFAGPKDLAEYIMKVDTNESLYKSYFKFDIRQTLSFQKNCPPEPIVCTMCKHLYHLKKQRCSWT